MAQPSETPHDALRVPFDTAQGALQDVLVRRGLSRSRAWRLAFVFAENSLVGVPSHGLNRFPRFIEWIDRGRVHVDAHPRQLLAQAAFERWDGHLGPGPLNADRAIHRSMRLALRHGLGCVTLSNTNHWLRAGTYVTRAAERGFVAACTTNTEPNLTTWGTQESSVGNNPIALAVPRPAGHPVVFDGALSQFSYGHLERASRHSEELPVPGGFDRTGTLSTDPAEILRTKRALPIGYWKGTGLALLLDLIVSGLADGRSTHDLGQLDAEYGVSQLFLTVAPSILTPRAIATLERTLTNHPTRYPGQRRAAERLTNLEYGIPVDGLVWQRILRL